MFLTSFEHLFLPQVRSKLGTDRVNTLIWNSSPKLGYEVTAVGGYKSQNIRRRPFRGCANIRDQQAE